VDFVFGDPREFAEVGIRRTSTWHSSANHRLAGEAWYVPEWLSRSRATQNVPAPALNIDPRGFLSAVSPFFQFVNFLWASVSRHRCEFPQAFSDCAVVFDDGHAVPRNRGSIVRGGTNCG
jgi:hypothetical protein